MLTRVLKSHRAMLGGFVFVLAAAINAPADAQTYSGGARAESDKLVAQAENLVAEAGKVDPADSAKIRRAIDKLHDAVNIDPRNDSAYVDLGFCYGVLRDGATAVDMYLKATQINPSGANFKELADIYLRTGDSEKALMAANAGITKDPNSPSLYNAKGMALNDLGRQAEAAEAFQRALRIDPNFAVARQNLKTLNSGSSGRGSVSRQ